MRTVLKQTMEKKTLPFTQQQVRRIIQHVPTPFYLYDKQGIRNTARQLNGAFSWAQGFKNYFAVKALPNPSILSILREEGMGADCSSLTELILAQKAGITRENIMFTSNDTPADEYKKALELGAIITIDDITHLPFLEKHARIPQVICFRYNPGPLKKGNRIIGNPLEAKFGCTREQLFEAYRIMRDKGFKRFGLHTMVASNELHAEYFVETARMLFDLVVELSASLGIRFEFINLGGGIGIPYKPEQQKVDLGKVSSGIKKAYDKTIVTSGLAPLRIVMECGRFVTGPHGYLVATVIHQKHIYKEYIGLDATMANLMRPGMYGAYHHITVLGKEKARKDQMYDVTGSLCENNDKFAVDRKLPTIEVGDIVVIHDVGAHGHSMGFNYNGKLRSAELLLKSDRSVVMIRRAETTTDYLRTLKFPGALFDL